MNENLSIQQVAELTGLTAHTLRYYERAGLMTSIGRGPNGHRRYSNDDLECIAFLRRLRSTGMPIAEMRRFAEMTRQGECRLADQHTLLKAHERRLDTQLHELEQTRAALARKIDVLARMMDHSHATDDEEVRP